MTIPLIPIYEDGAPTLFPTIKTETTEKVNCDVASTFLVKSSCGASQLQLAGHSNPNGGTSGLTNLDVTDLVLAPKLSDFIG